MEEKKKGKGLKIVLAIFIALFLLTALALGYGYTKYQKLKNDNTNLNTKYENVNKEYNELKDENTKISSDLNNTKDKLSSSDKHYVEIKDIFPDGKSYNLYSLSTTTSVVGFEKKIYYFDLAGLSGEYSNCALKLIYDGAKFKDGRAVCSPDADEDEGTGYIYKTDIKEKDLYKAISTSLPGNTGYNYAIFFILKDGSVKTEGGPEFDIKDKLNKYKIKDIEKFYCSSGFKDTCKDPLKLDVVLQDGSKKTIEL